MTDVSVGVRAKRKRGRPRKDSNLCREGSLQSPENSCFMKTQGGGGGGAAELAYPTPADGTKKAQQECSDEGMVGSMVYGVVEGSFDAGYLISVRIGSNLTPFRGVVFQPRKVVAVTPANDVAPQAKMYQRREIPVPVYDSNNLSQGSGFSQPKQTVVRPLLPYNQSSFMAADEAAAAAMLRTGSSSNMEAKQFPYVHPTGSLRMVEEDEVMQAFEVSTSSNLAPTNGGGDNNIPGGKESINQVQEAQVAVDQLESMAPPPAFEIRQDHMICRETMDQLQEMNAGGQNQSESPQAMKATTTADLYYNEARSQDVNFHENLFTDANSREGDISKSPNLKLDLAFTVHKEKQMAGDSSIYTVLNGMKNPNIGYHQALVAGNPLLLPPDLMGEPLEFMMERPKTPPNCKTSEETMEVQSRLVHGVGDDGEGAGGGAGASSYKLELATPHTRIADMDFVLSNAIQPTQSNGHGNGISPCPSQTNQ